MTTTNDSGLLQVSPHAKYRRDYLNRRRPKPLGVITEYEFINRFKMRYMVCNDRAREQWQKENDMLFCDDCAQPTEVPLMKQFYPLVITYEADPMGSFAMLAHVCCANCKLDELVPIEQKSDSSDMADAMQMSLSARQQAKQGMLGQMYGANPSQQSMSAMGQSIHNALANHISPGPPVGTTAAKLSPPPSRPSMLSQHMQQLDNAIRSMREVGAPAERIESMIRERDKIVKTMVDTQKVITPVDFFDEVIPERDRLDVMVDKVLGIKSRYQK